MMDRALKERIIGAVALVTIIVLVVPVFLDGPSEENVIVSEPVALPGQNEQARKRQTIVLERERDQPVPVSSGRSAANEADASAADQKPAPQPVSTAKPEPATTRAVPASQEAGSQKEPDMIVAEAEAAEKAGSASTTGMWAVQLGSFSSQENAERLAAELRQSGFAAFLSKHQASGTALHRVRVGPQKDRASAEAVAVKLGASGHKGQVVTHP